MREIGKEGKVWRLSKASWDFLLPFDSDPNEALKKIQAQLNAKPTPTPQDPQQPPHGCNFDEKKLKETIKDAVEEAIAPFTS